MAIQTSRDARAHRPRLLNNKTLAYKFSGRNL